MTDRRFTRAPTPSSSAYKTVRPMLSVRCPVLSVTFVHCGLWPNGWTDQDETWHADRPRHWPHCVRWGPAPLPKGAHICCGQMAAWIKMSLGMELGIGPGDFVLDGDHAPLPQKGAEPPPQIFGPCLLRPNGWLDEAGTWHGGRPQPAQATLCLLASEIDPVVWGTPDNFNGFRVWQRYCIAVKWSASAKLRR